MPPKSLKRTHGGDDDDASSWTSRIDSDDDENSNDSRKTAPVDSYQQTLDAVEANRLRATGGEPYSAFASPPLTPGDVGPPPTSPRARSREEYFKRRKYGELLRSGNGFKEAIENVEGMRKWWASNKKAWHEKRLDMKQIDTVIARTQDSAQIQVQAQKRADTLRWFEDNGTLMKMVWERYQIFMEVEDPNADPANPVDQVEPAEESSYIVNNSPRLNPIFNAVSNQGIRFEYRSPRDPENTLRWLVDLKTADWWLERALDDLKSHSKRLETLIEDLPGHKSIFLGLHQALEARLESPESIAALDARVDAAIIKVMDERPIYFKEQIQGLIERRRRIKNQLEFEKDYKTLAAYKLKPTEIDTILKLLNQQNDIAEIIKDVLVMTRHELYTHELDKRNKEVFHDLHTICFLYNDRRRLSLVVRSTLADGQLPVETKRLIISAVQKFTVDCNFVENIPYTDDGRFRAHHIKAFCNQMIAANEGLIKLQKYISEIIQQQALPAPDYRLLPITDPKLLLQRPQMTAGLSPAILGFASNMTLLTARTMLEEAKPGRKSNMTIIQELFISPDIFPLFHPNYQPNVTWTRSEFRARINSRLERDFSNELIEAFLIYCTHTNELVRLTYFGQKIYPIYPGWETCYERRKNGLKRAIPEQELYQPENLRVIEDLFNDKLLVLASSRNDRIFPASHIIDAINKYMPTAQKIDPLQFAELVNFWSHMGRYFIKPPVHPRLQGEHVLRIDNGWDIKPTRHFPALGRKHRYYDRVREDILLKDPFPILRLEGKKEKQYFSTEGELYDFFFGVKEGGKEVGNWETTRFKFHLYLRWCTTKKDSKFELTRDGVVKVALDQWLINEAVRDWGDN